MPGTTPTVAPSSFEFSFELTVDQVIEDQKLLEENGARTSLAKKLKVVAKALRKQELIPAKLVTAVRKFADGKFAAGSVYSLHQFVHNQYTFPQHDELFAAWDQLEPFIKAIWAPAESSS